MLYVCKTLNCCNNTINLSVLSAVHFLKIKFKARRVFFYLCLPFQRKHKPHASKPLSNLKSFMVFPNKSLFYSVPYLDWFNQSLSNYHKGLFYILQIIAFSSLFAFW